MSSAIDLTRRSDAAEWLDGAEISEEDRRKIARGNAEALFKLGARRAEAKAIPAD